SRRLARPVPIGAVKLQIALPGNNHLPGTPGWMTRLRAPDHQRIARVIDELGFHTITTMEHLAMPIEEIPRLGPYWTHALSVMGFVAGATRRVRIDTSVLVLPYHHPLALAKAIATIDVLSGGRVNLSVGVGHAVREFEVLGVPFSERGAWTDEMLDAIKKLWTAEHPVHHGRYFHIDGLAFAPKPVQKPRPPIYVGGNSPAALRRAARHDGWQPNPTDFTIGEVPPLYDYIRAQPEFRGKEETFDVCWLGFPDDVGGVAFRRASSAERTAVRDRLLAGFALLRSTGVTRTPVPVARTESVEEYLDYLRWFSAEVQPEVQASGRSPRPA
ncbi:MAG TPA: TIGR03619 family F420-dependent LLM class oxidoreductase, partial [Acidimicrobiales bacterium]|nr:TIGR03619 family F420-dependent LLM class oxidoreductase [Acidimicrobiales bacterium]